MDEHLDGHTPDDAEGAQHVKGRRGGEAEDGLAFVEHNEGLGVGEGREKLSLKDGQTDGQKAQKEGALPHPDLLVTVVRVQVLQGDADDFRWGVPIDER